MSATVLLDTHVWLWYATGHESALSREGVRRLIELDRQGHVAVSIMSVWEIGLLQERGRIRLGCATAAWVDAFLRSSRFAVLGLSLDIVTEVHQLPGELHRDPVDRFLIATSRQHRCTLITEDEQILAYGAQGHVDVARPAQSDRY